MSNLYEYQPLQGDSVQIRILHLVQNVGEEELICQIEFVDVDKATFTALSYVWGDPEQPYHIQVRDAEGQDIGVIPLTANLNTAIHNLRDSPDIKAQTFWIDQICINQKDDNEKGHQVALMSKVYSMAEGVITYTGAQEAGDDEALDLVRRICQHYSSVSDEIMDDFAQSIDLYRLKRRILPVGPFVIDEYGLAWTSFCNLIDDEWTKRLWMLQERVLNKNVVLLRGQLTIPLESIHVVTMLYVYAIFGTLARAEEFFFAQNIVGMLCRANNRSGGGPSSASLVGLLPMTPRYECSDDRDYVYALLGLARDANQFEILPDYTKPSRTILIDCAFKLVHKSVGIKVWNQVPPLSVRDVDFPSWASFLDMQGMKAGLSSSTLYGKSSIDIQQDCSMDPETSRLKLAGISISKITERLGIFDTELSWIYNNAKANDDLKNFLSMMKKARKRLQNTQYADAVIYRTMIADVEEIEVFESNLSKLQVGKSFRLMLNILKSRYLYPLSKIRMAPRKFKKSLLNLTGCQEKNSEHIEELAWNWLANNRGVNRSLLWTSDGKLVLGPIDAEPGDYIKSFLGAGNLSVLRPIEDGQYLMIGDAYVDGLMNGELYQKNKWRDEVEYFQIR